jgi:hypothetical protein
MKFEDIQNAKIIGFVGNGIDKNKMPEFYSIQIEIDGKLYDIKSTSIKARLSLTPCPVF